MPYFSSSKNITHFLYVDNREGGSGIGYEMIVGLDLMLQIGLKEKCGFQILEWDDVVVPMKDTVNFMGKPNLN